MNEISLKNILECLLFVSDRPLTLDSIRKILRISKQDVLNLIQEIKEEYKNKGLQIMEIAQTYQISTKPEYAEYIRKMYIKPAVKLSKQALETLAIIAYRQPITRGEIEKFRGVNTDGVLETLSKRKLVKIMGRKKVVGRPFIYGTTEDFLRYFGLKNLEELPKLEKLEQEKLG